jgi:hypothetical protein
LGKRAKGFTQSNGYVTNCKYDASEGKTMIGLDALNKPVAWIHNFIDDVVIAHRPNDIDRHPDRWTALYKDPTPCQTCQALARTVMMDQTAHD